MEFAKKKIKISDIILLVLLGLATVFEVGRFTFVSDATLNTIITVIITRFIASAFFFVVIVVNKYNVFSFKGIKPILLILPCFLVAVNNLPIYALVTKQCEITGETYEIILFGVQCVAVGMFEELAFRGLFLPLVLEKHGKTKKEIFLSVIITGCVFGLYHLVNLFAGAGIGNTLLQVLYSSLIGAMCGAVLVITGNVFVCGILHAIYNFCGTIVPTLGSGNMLNLITIVITAIISVCVLVYMIVLFFKYEDFKYTEIYKK